MAAAWHQGVVFPFRVGKRQKVKPVGSILGQQWQQKKIIKGLVMSAQGCKKNYII